jgi:DNA repair exonuclease SbcCD ATPase subunit
LVSTRAGAQTTLDTSKKALRKHVESKRRLEAAETETADRRRELVGALNEVLVHWEGITPDAVEVPVIQAINAAVVLAEQYPTPDPKIKNTDLETLIREILAKLSDATQQTGIEIEQAAETARDDLERSTALGHLVTFLRYSKALDELDGALSGSDLAEARVLVDATSKRLETLHVVADVAEELSGAEATARAAALSPVINQWFERTSLHEQLVRASLNVASSRPGGRITNAYTIRAINDDGTWTASPGPELSGGYEALLAVAVLCALSDPRFQQHSLGLVMLDEPTESLDDVLSRRLGETLGRDAPAPRTIVTTIDRQFAEAVQSAAGVTRAKVVELEEWNLAEGTRFMESTKS